MNPLNLLWICPLSASFGLMWTCLLVAAGRSDKHDGN